MRLNHFTLADAAAWSRTLASRAPECDVYFWPAYLRAVEATGEGRAHAVFVTDGPQWLFLPYLRTPDQVRGANYGGPLGFGDPAFLCEAWRQIGLLWRSQGAAKEAFLRLHPMMDQRPLLPGWTIEDNRETVSMAGAGSKSHRNAVTQANRLGLYCWRMEANATDLREGFRPLYDAAMVRKGAAAAYRFRDAYFEALLALGPALRLYTIPDGAGKPHVAALALFGPQWASYHLSARTPDGPSCATNLLLESMAIDAREAGLVGVHLGGGVSVGPEDSLFWYKARVGDGRHTFRTAIKGLGR